MEETCSLKVGLSTESDLSVEFYNFSAICDIYNVSEKEWDYLSCEWMCREEYDECMIISFICNKTTRFVLFNYTYVSWVFSFLFF